jgi:head-tail adaptor
MKQPHLSRPLMLEAPTRVSDGSGGYSIVWTGLGTLWADVVSGVGREAAVTGARLSRVPVRIVVRAAPYGAPSRPKPDQRFRDGGRTYTILAVTERDPEGRYLTCHALEEEAA